MGRLTHCIIIFTLSVSSAFLCGRANAQTNLQSKAPKRPTGSISGRVTVKGKGKGGIVVGARTGELGQQIGTLRKAISDGDGNYRVTDLPAGTYQVTPVALAFLISDINPMSRQGKSVILTEGENVDDIDFSMLRGGVITGRVAHADGRPVIDERINITLAEQTNPATGPTQFGTQIQTDDRGIYRVFGLPAGRYKVSIGQGPDTFPGGNIPGRRAYERVYYPDVTNASEARVVELGEGSEA
ncbi:MAG TPA: hypothetical protein VMS31_00745, partial [Pyrinomonadaceae bacterium]|nr:hypothetical protein [Pyrinomonadaceae bacterium]